MKIASRLFFIVAIVLFIVGYWGYFTHSRSSYFDEMDGMIPFFALADSGIAVLCCMILVIIQKIKK